jgi:hypothetical protein
LKSPQPADLVRNLVLVIALCLCSMSVSAAPLTLQECKAKYKAAMAAGGGAAPGNTWVGFQEKICGITPPERRPKSSH